MPTLSRPNWVDGGVPRPPLTSLLEVLLGEMAISKTFEWTCRSMAICLWTEIILSSSGINPKNIRTRRLLGSDMSKNKLEIRARLVAAELAQVRLRSF